MTTEADAIRDRKIELNNAVLALCRERCDDDSITIEVLLALAVSITFSRCGCCEYHAWKGLGVLERDLRNKYGLLMATEIKEKPRAN